MFKIVFTYCRPGYICVDPGPVPMILHSLAAAQSYAQSVVSANYAGRCAAGLATRPTNLRWARLSFKGFRSYYPDACWAVYVVPFSW